METVIAFVVGIVAGFVGTKLYPNNTFQDVRFWILISAVNLFGYPIILNELLK